MPIYEVRCAKCGKTREILALALAAEQILRMYGEPCPRANCGGRMWPVPARVGIAFKGNGWSTPSARAEDKPSKERQP